MERPNHGYDRSASHQEDEYVCYCGHKACYEADYAWMDWAERRIERLESLLKTEQELNVAQARHRLELKATIERYKEFAERVCAGDAGNQLLLTKLLEKADD